MKILKFPELRQTYNYDCGAKAIQTVLAYYGIDEREEVIIKLAKTKKSGTYINGIVNALKKYDLKTKVKNLTIEDLKKYIDKGNPVILVLQAWTDKKKINWKKDWLDGHYVVAIGYDKSKIYFADPSSILRTYLSYKELKDRWHDKDVGGKKYVNYGIIVYGKKPKFDFKKIIHMD